MRIAAFAKRKQSLNRAELNSVRALSALCGGSGVGQAPELPQRAPASSFQASLLIGSTPCNFNFANFWLQKIVIAERRKNFPRVVVPCEGSRYIFALWQSISRKRLPKNEVILTLTSKETEIAALKKPQILWIFEWGKAKIGKLRQKHWQISVRLEVGQRFLRFLSHSLIGFSLLGLVFAWGPVALAEGRWQLVRILPRTGIVKPKVEKMPLPPDPFAKIEFPSDASIVIPKIETSTEFVPNVNPADYDEYMAALQHGVAHAKGTALPGEVGNFYVFAHSAGNLFDIARFNAVFYLIDKLEPGDAIFVKFGREKFKYVVYDKKEVEATEVAYLANRKDNGAMMTMQTCTPPGTSWRRLLVFASLTNADRGL